MAATQSAIQQHREDAEITLGHEVCMQKALQLLAEVDLPSGLLPLQDMVELGYNRTTGFLWVKQKKSISHTFQAIGETVSFAEEVTAFVEKHRMSKCTGVKSKFSVIWISIGEIIFNEKDPEKLTFKTPNGKISRSYPVSAFKLEEGEVKKIVEGVGK